ncbi:cell division inhibitor SepF [Gracilibacillus ureilyticus]|uniref:Cell division protein SepF n=1 Tax=Gracilibacillus ureilyticus TaxID=531814 RepID=A0A1H9KYW6_9BACI|nr:cell division protein SepF [Gracilibacillus ureilyticus]SER04360.1 cell division inhibitor SepF [Gracilibacillus ureilyticus]
MSMKGKFKNLFGLEDEYEIIHEEIEEQGQYETNEQEEKSNVVSLKSVQSSSKVVLCEPRSYNEVQEIADHVVNRRSVVMNLQRLDAQQARQIIDFMSGTVYAMSGHIRKLGSQTFLCTPDHVEISGNITEVMEEYDSDQRW